MSAVHTSCDDTMRVDSLQISKEGITTIYELFNGCPPCHEMNGFTAGDPGFYIRELTGKDGCDTDGEFTRIFEGPLESEDEGLDRIEALRETNEAFITG